MKTIQKYVLSVLLLLLAHSAILQAQRVSFQYDASGNRLSGKTILITSDTPDPAEAPELPEEKEEDTEETQDETPAEFSEIIGEITVSIYPNPTEGQLKVAVAGHPEKETIVVRLYDLSGRTITQKESGASPVDLDITSQPKGTYILIVRIGAYQSDWKIIKN